MEQVTFNGMLIVGLAGLVAFGAALITPILKLNTSIVSLNNTIQTLLKNDEKQNQALDDHSKLLANHETRITVMESNRPHT